MSRFFVFLFPLVAWFGTVSAQFVPASDGSDIKSDAEMVPDATAIAPGGSVTFAIKLAHPAHWHSYYRNSGGVESPISIKWDLPPGYRAGPLQWPVPKQKPTDYGISLLYDPGVTLLAEVTAPADAKPGDTAALTAHVSWQICSATGCQDEDEAFKFRLTVAVGAKASPPTPLFQNAFAHVAKTGAPWKITAVSADDKDPVALQLTPLPGSGDAEPTGFIPDQRFILPLPSAGKITKDGDTWTLTLERTLKDKLMDTDIEQGKSLSGMVVTKDGRAFVISGTPILTAPSGVPAPAGATPDVPYLLVFGAMLLGGLVLNLMPCVFPVIGLKIMGFVKQAGADRRKIVLHGLVFTAGVLVSFGVLSGVLYGLREAGQARTWGSQLENPWLVLGLLMLMLALALNMAGVFEMGVSATSVGGGLQQKSGLAGSFFSGVLATIVSTPCSAPFLGWGLGVAMGLPAAPYFTAFAMMGVGLSLPYLLLSAFPSLVERLPRPGAWMESLKQGMSFLLFATVGYLLWVYASQIRIDNMLEPVLGLVCVSAAAWIYGRWCPVYRSRLARRAGLVFALAFATGGIWLALPPKPPALVWEPWSQAKQETLLKEGKPVYVDYTAAWCATCQANKRIAYTPAVAELMKRKGIVALKADKTMPNPEIDAAIRSLGRSAVPVNVLLVPGKKPVVTPEALTPGYLTDLFNREVP